MNQKYKPGIIFGIFSMTISIINALFIFPVQHPSSHIAVIIIGSLIGGATGGFLYGWFTILYETRKAKTI
jgi:NAD/NADP transhydrogenase beta subunit